jgi:hypothetical protein
MRPGGRDFIFDFFTEPFKVSGICACPFFVIF